MILFQIRISCSCCFCRLNIGALFVLSSLLGFVFLVLVFRATTTCGLVEVGTVVFFLWIPGKHLLRKRSIKDEEFQQECEMWMPG